MSPSPDSPLNFLGLSREHSELADSRAVVLPLPYEATTSYKTGTHGGPGAILDASQQVELYDREFDAEPALQWGVHTLPALALDGLAPEQAVDAIANAVAAEASRGKLLCALGGEHTVSVGVARGLRQVFGDFVTVQLDAHADLRDTYDDTPYSHACTARRIVEFSPVVQLGIRSLCNEEAAFIGANPERVTTFFADEMRQSQNYLTRLAERIRGKQVFLTVDLDVFDPSLMPAVGTPEPGGLDWYAVLDIARVVARESTIIGFDCVELSPSPGLHLSEFTAAKLIYKLFALCLARS